MRHQAAGANLRVGNTESKMRSSLRRLGAGARRLTNEAVPRLANYSNIFQMATTGTRPTMEELHESIVEEKVYIYTNSINPWVLLPLQNKSTIFNDKQTKFLLRWDNDSQLIEE